MGSDCEEQQGNYTINTTVIYDKRHQYRLRIFPQEEGNTFPTLEHNSTLLYRGLIRHACPNLQFNAKTARQIKQVYSRSLPPSVDFSQMVAFHIRRGETRLVVNRANTKQTNTFPGTSRSNENRTRTVL